MNEICCIVFSMSVKNLKQSTIFSDTQWQILESCNVKQYHKFCRKSLQTIINLLTIFPWSLCTPKNSIYNRPAIPTLFSLLLSQWNLLKLNIILRKEKDYEYNDEKILNKYSTDNVLFSIFSENQITIFALSTSLKQRR